MSDLRASLWRRAAGLVEPLSERALQGQIARGEVPAHRASERRGVATVPSPGGPVVWFHTRGMSRALDLSGVMARLWDEQGDVEILLTTRLTADEGALTRRLPAGVIHQFLPFDRPAAVKRFLDHWQPRLCFWSDTPDPAVALSGIGDRGIPVCVLPGDAIDTWLSRRIRPRLRQVSQVFAEDTEMLAKLREAGVAAGRVTITGAPREDALAPDVDATGREQLARNLEGRPVWLAAGVPQEELTHVLDAHRTAHPLVPRVALILLPADDVDVAEFSKVLDASGLPWTRAADLGLGAAPPEIILADTARGAALWYHLATVSYIGGSLVHHGGQSPQIAAALGSAILHGPHTGYFSDLFDRLSDAGAARRVADAAALGEAVAEVIEPRVAAEMAHNAWRVSSEGAEATDTIVAALSDLLDGMNP